MSPLVRWTAAAVAALAVTAVTAIDACSPFEGSAVDPSGADAGATADGRSSDAQAPDGSTSDGGDKPWQELTSSFRMTDSPPFGWDSSEPSTSTVGRLVLDPLLGDLKAPSLALGGNVTNAYLEKAVGDAAEIEISASIQVLSFTGSESIHAIHLECDEDRAVYLRLVPKNVGTDAELGETGGGSYKPVGYSNTAVWMRFRSSFRRFSDRTEMRATMGTSNFFADITSTDGPCPNPRVRVGASSVSSSAVYDMRLDDVFLRWR